MPIPVVSDPWSETEPDRAWSTLSAEEKHERILCTAYRLFSEQGLDAPMPAVAARAGAGVGSLYRQFPSKHELLAAIVQRRLEQIHEAAVAANLRPGSRWRALTEMLWAIMGRQHGDAILGQAWPLVADHADVMLATDRVQRAVEQLLAAARAEGSIRPDATADDIRLVFTATRSTSHIGTDAWKRMLELLIDGLRRQAPERECR